MAILRNDPYGAYNFIVDLGIGDGSAPAAGFSEVTGLGSEIEYAEYRNGNDKENHVRRIPSLHKTSNVTLKRGVIGDLGLFEWVKATRQGDLQPRNVTITLPTRPASRCWCGSCGPHCRGSWSARRSPRRVARWRSRS
jgi:phage tail-like protein